MEQGFFLSWSLSHRLVLYHVLVVDNYVSRAIEVL